MCTSYKNIFIKTLSIETLYENIKTCLQKQRKKLRKILEKLDFCWSYIICISFSGWGAQFAAAFEELALKKTANNEVVTLIQKIFDQKRRENDFTGVNEAEIFTNVKGVVREYTPLDTSLEKLRRKYTTLKAE